MGSGIRPRQRVEATDHEREEQVAITEPQTPTVQMISLAQINTDHNVREQLIAEEVGQLAQSIVLLGQLSPVSVRPDGRGGYVLIAGHKRCAALAKLGREAVRAEVRDSAEDEASERAAENIVRSALNPAEEAAAVRAMLDRGLTVDGVAQALGWSRARVTARTRLLELPERARQSVGAGVIPLSAIEVLRTVQASSPEMLGVLVEFVANGGAGHGERLLTDPGWLLAGALRECDGGVFAARLDTISGAEVEKLRLGKKAKANLERATELAEKLDRYSYGPRIRFADGEIDQARAAGALLELERAAPIIVERALYRELCKQTRARTVTDLETEVQRRAEDRRAERQAARETPPTPEQAAQRRERAVLRDVAADAHGVNLDLGRSLMNDLSTIDPPDMDLARFLVFALLDADHDGSPWTQSGERVARLAVSGIRLVIEQFRTDITKTRKDGTRGARRIDYGSPQTPEDPIKWLWKYLDGARTASELYGRALVVILAEQHACRLVVPHSQQTPPIRWDSHNNKAARALAKLAKGHLPGSLTQLQKAIERAHTETGISASAAASQADETSQ